MVADKEDGKVVQFNIANVDRAPHQRDSLTEDQIERVKRFRRVLGEGDLMTFEEHVDNLCRDLDPERELLTWEHIAEAYHSYTLERTLPRDQKRYAVTVLILRSAQTDAEVIASLQQGGMLRPVAREILKHYRWEPIRMTIGPSSGGAEEHLNRGIAHSQNGEYDQAIANFTEAIRLDSTSAAAYFHRGNIHLQTGGVDDAIADYTEAIRLNPDVAVAYSNRGAAYGMTHQLDKSISDYNQAIRLNPQYVEAYVGRAGTYGKQGAPDKAIADCNEAIRLSPDYAQAYFNRCVAYKLKGELDKAMADYEKAHQLSPIQFPQK